MSERIRGSYDDVLYKSTYTLCIQQSAELSGCNTTGPPHAAPGSGIAGLLAAWGGGRICRPFVLGFGYWALLGVILVS